MQVNVRRSVRTDLDPDFRQVDLEGQLLPAVHVRIVRLLKGPLQLVKLVRGERGAVTPVFLLVGAVIRVSTLVIARVVASAHRRGRGGLGRQLAFGGRQQFSRDGVKVTLAGVHVMALTFWRGVSQMFRGARFGMDFFI